jgi:hypothetical protein
MKVKTAHLIGVALDWAVCKSGGGAEDIRNFICGYYDRNLYRYSELWSQGGRIIEREGIELLCNLTADEAERFTDGTHADWQAFYRGNRSTDARQYARTPLVAAMRAYVARKLGDTVDVPEELI